MSQHTKQALLTETGWRGGQGGALCCRTLRAPISHVLRLSAGVSPCALVLSVSLGQPKWHLGFVPARFWPRLLLQCVCAHTCPKKSPAPLLYQLSARGSAQQLMDAVNDPGWLWQLSAAQEKALNLHRQPVLGAAGEGLEANLL